MKHLLGWFAVIAVTIVMVWSMYFRPVPPAEHKAPSVAELNQKAACDTVQKAKQELISKGLTKQAEKLDVGSVCDPDRSMRYGIYALIGVPIFVVGFFLLVATALTPKR